MQIPTDSSSWANVITPLLVGAYIALDRFTAWRAARDRVVTQQKIDTVHTLVNGRSEAAAAKIAELTTQVAELKQEKAALIAAFAAKPPEPSTPGKATP